MSIVERLNEDGATLALEAAAKIEADAKVIAALRGALDGSARTFGILALAAKNEGMGDLAAIATQYARAAEETLAAYEQTAGEKHGNR